MRVVCFILLVWISKGAFAQEEGFPFGKVTYRELDLDKYDKDTAAYAVVLDEFGEAYFDNGGDHNLIFEYHVKIKILKKKGLALADVEIPLRKSEGRFERVTNIQGSSFSYQNGSMREFQLDTKNVFTENINKYWDVKKFAIPQVQVGSVIEYAYKIETPYFFNFRTWNFQAAYPKIRSEFWAKIPANYRYNIALRGFYKLSKEEAENARDCFAPYGNNKADCAWLRWGMNDIPAFVEAEYMTAPSNFLSAIHFELAEMQFFDGRKDKFTKEWKDAEIELRTDEKFGRQLKRGKEILDGHIDVVSVGETDPLKKAQKIFDFIKFWFQWNEGYGIFSELGIKKAFDTKTGNVGDINLSLVAALRYAGFDADPVLLSTRKNGLVTELYPVISEFNYVIVRLILAEKTYLLDATDHFLPFGSIPDRCLNGKGRVLGEESSWINIIPSDKEKTMQVLSLVVQPDGKLKGVVQLSYFGYDAVNMRKKLARFSNPEEYVRDLDNRLDYLIVEDFVLTNIDDLAKPVLLSLTVEMDGFDDLQSSHLVFNPFLLERWEKNPFRADERLYPVDFGAPLEEVVILNLTYPEGFQLVELPPKVGLQLPNAGGRYIFDIRNQNNILTMQSALYISKPVFSSAEYQYLKELFARVISVQHMDLMFTKK